MRRRGYSAIGLCGPKTASNVGAVLRAAGCYGAAMVATGGSKVTPEAATNTQKAHRHIPFFRVDNILDVVPEGCEAVCVELEAGATPIQNFVHPERAFYILGPEDGSVPLEISSACKYRVYIPTRFCMNLAATANVVLFDRMMKRGEFETSKIESELARKRLSGCGATNE